MRRVLRACTGAVRLLLFPDDIARVHTQSAVAKRAWDVFVRVIFSAYYIPILMLLLVAVLNTLLHIAFAAVIPAVQAQCPLLTQLTVGVAIGHACRLMFMLVPYVTACMGLLLVCHKFVKCIGEAMVDSFSVFNGVDYSLTLAMFSFMLESNRRVAILTLVAVSACTLAAVVFLTDAVLMWTSRRFEVLVTVWSIVVTQLAAVGLSVTNMATIDAEEPGSPQTSFASSIVSPASGVLRVRAFVIRWWRENMMRIRHAAIQMLFCFGVWWGVTLGPIDAVAICVESLMYLNLPNVVGFTVLAAAVSTTRGVHSLRWLARHRHFTWTVAMLILPYSATWLYTAAFFEFSRGMSILTCFALLSLVVRAIQLCEQWDVSCSGRVSWVFADGDGVTKRPDEVPAFLAAELENALQRGTNRPAVVSVEFKYNASSLTLENRTSGVVRKLKRTASADTRAVPPPSALLQQLLPRLLFFQSAQAFTGNRFNRTRIALKVVMSVCVFIIFTFVGGSIVQETVAPLQPLPVLMSQSDGVLSVNHYVVNLRVTKTNTEPPPAGTPLDGARVQSDDELGSMCVRTESGVSLLELGLFAAGAYLHDGAAVNDYVGFVNDALATDWVVVSPRHGDSEPTRLPGKPWNSMVTVRSDAKNVTVVAVRGTDPTSMFDMLQDVALYVETFLYQAMTHLVPLSAMVPSALVADVIELAAAVESHTVPWSRSNVSRHFHDVVRKQITRVSLNSERVVVTGHSLGGAIAHIAAAQAHIRSVGFSSPGIVLPRKKLGITTDQINFATTTIAPSHDIVPQIGWQGGEVLFFRCVDNFRERCHAIEATVAAIWHRCGSVRRAFPGLADVAAL